MKVEIKILTNSCCDNLLKFSKDESIKERYGLSNYPKECLLELKTPTKYFIDEDLVLSPKAEDDLENSISIFKQLKNLDRVQANDRRLWVALTHGRFFRYTKERWNPSKYSNDAILRRFHYEGSGLETRMRNSISRLWWAAKVTYDNNRTDPFELTKLLWSKQDLIQNILERSFGTNRNVVIGILETYRDNPGISEDNLRVLYTGLNAVGGVKILSFLTVDEIKSELARIALFNNINLEPG